MTDETYDEMCPACGDPIDYCQGHGRIGDPLGYGILRNHEQGRHDACHPFSDCYDLGHHAEC